MKISPPLYGLRKSKCSKKKPTKTIETIVWLPQPFNMYTASNVPGSYHDTLGMMVDYFWKFPSILNITFGFQLNTKLKNANILFKASTQIHS